MNRRPFTEEAPPQPTITEFRMPPDHTGDGVDLAEAIIARAIDAGAQPELDAATLALYAEDDTLRTILARKEPVTDIREYLRDHGIEIPERGI